MLVVNVRSPSMKINTTGTLPGRRNSCRALRLNYLTRAETNSSSENEQPVNVCQRATGAFHYRYTPFYIHVNPHNIRRTSSRFGNEFQACASRYVPYQRRYHYQIDLVSLFTWRGPAEEPKDGSKSKRKVEREISKRSWKMWTVGAEVTR